MDENQEIRDMVLPKAAFEAPNVDLSKSGSEDPHKRLVDYNILERHASSADTKCHINLANGDKEDSSNDVANLEKMIAPRHSNMDMDKEETNVVTVDSTNVDSADNSQSSDALSNTGNVQAGRISSDQLEFFDGKEKDLE